MDETEGVEHLKSNLYSREHQGTMRDVRAPLSKPESEAPKRWSDSPLHPRVQPQPPRSGMAFATKFLIGSALFFVLAALGAGFFFFSGSNYISTQNIDLQVVAPALINGGTAASVQFIIQNRNQAELQLADLVVDYPEGTRDPKNPTKSLSHERLSIGTIESGRQIKLTSGAIFYGGEGSTQTIKATLEYSVAGSNAVFAKEAQAQVTLGSSPVSVRVDSPQEAIAGEPFTLTITVQSNAQEPVQNVVVQGQYPFGFSVQTTAPRADAGGTLWRLGTMAPGATQTITVRGGIDGQDGDERVFRFLAGTNADQTASKVAVPFLSVPTTLTVRRPFITGSILIEGQSGSKISAPAGKALQGTVVWQNNLSEGVSDVQLKLKLSGAPLDKSSIEPGSGFYQSSDNSITWTSAQDPSLAQVPPGGQGTLNFSFATLSPGTGGVVYQNPTVSLMLGVSAARAGESGVPETVQSAATTQVSLASAVALVSKAMHYTGPYTNSGPMPPRSGSQTNYTVQWSVKNSSNALGNASVSTVLPPYVSFVAGQEGITYESGSRTVRWALGDVPAGAGYSLGAKIASFQIALTPSDSQVGQSPQLTGTAQLQGTDRFAQVGVSASADAPTIMLTEAGFGAAQGVVQAK